MTTQQPVTASHLPTEQQPPRSGPGPLYSLIHPDGQPLVLPRRKIGPGERDFALDQPKDKRQFWPAAMVVFQEAENANRLVAAIGVPGMTVETIKTDKELDRMRARSNDHGLKYLALCKDTSTYFIRIDQMRLGN